MAKNPMGLNPVEALKKILGLVRLTFSRFFSDLGLQNAAALTYSTLLSLVPAMTVIFAVLAIFPIADRMAEAVQDFIFSNFLPASGEVIQQNIEGFVSKASRLTGPSFILLFIVAMLMMNNIDSALNRIWGTRKARGTARKFLVYWALLTLGPLLVIASMAATSYLVSLPLMVEAEQRFHFSDFLISFAPIVISAFAFMLMYVAIPNRRVNWINAFAGGLVAALLFELAKRGFGYYVTNFPSYEAIYGAFAAVPIFLVWIYLSWIIFLLGAEFTHSLEIYRHRGTLASAASSELDRAMSILAMLHGARREGKALRLNHISDQLDLPPVEVDQLLSDFVRTGIVLRTDSGKWALAKDLREMTLYQLYHGLEIPLPNSSMAAGLDDASTERLERKLREADASIADILSIPIEELLVKETTE